MSTPFTYDFGYSFMVAWGHVVPVAIFTGLFTLAVSRGWSRWIAAISAGLAIWALISLFILQLVVGINLPEPLPTDRFLPSGPARVLDLGAGSGRATVGLLLARPQVRVTAVDIYRGYFGIADNTPDRLLTNARIAGVADRVEVKVGDMRHLPFEAGSIDGVISVAAMDHLNRAGMREAVFEVARVLKPGGEFLLELVSADGWLWFAMPVPHGMGHHYRADAPMWRNLLKEAGFELLEDGSRPARWYFFSKKRLGA